MMQKTKVAIVMLFLLTGSILILINGCKKDDDSNPVPQQPQLIVGQDYQGGVIAYIFQIGDSDFVAGETHGIISSKVQLNQNVLWGCEPVNIGTSRALGAGKKNTTDIIASCTSSGIAAKICADLVQGGYTDWYLPSAEELKKVYLIKNVIGGFQSQSYWSSTELGFGNAIFILFSDGYEGNTSKMQNYLIHPVRKF